MTGIDLISASLRACNVLASGETAPASEVEDARVILNQMLEAWGADQLTVFTLTRVTFSLVAGTQNYTLGTGGTFNSPRPAQIDYASIVSNSNPSQPLELEIKIYSDAEWQAVPVKSVQSTLPQGVYDDGGFPLRSLSYWPVPSDSSVKTVLGNWTALTQFTDLTTDNTFPPGYMEAIKYNLAVRIAAEWPGNLSQGLAALAQQSLARIKTRNVPDIIMKADPAVITENGGRYDWRTDRYK